MKSPRFKVFFLSFLLVLTPMFFSHNMFRFQPTIAATSSLMFSLQKQVYYYKYHNRLFYIRFSLCQVPICDCCIIYSLSLFYSFCVIVTFFFFFLFYVLNIILSYFVQTLVLTLLLYGLLKNIRDLLLGKRSDHSPCSLSTVAT